MQGMDLNSDSESEASVEVELPEATLELHEGADDDEGEEEDESEEGVGQTEAAAAARRQAEAEGLTLQPSSYKAGYRHVCKDERKPSRFNASVRRAGEKVYLGSFSTAEEAALAYARTPEAQEEVAHPKPVPLTAEEAVAQAAAEGLKLEPSYRCASGYRGVKVDGSRYHARAMRDGKNVHLGSFSTAEEAALAVARAVACTDSSPRLAAAKRATQPPKPPPAKQPRSSLVPGALPSVSGCRDGVAVEEAEPLLAFIGLVVHKQFEGTLARTHTACDVPHAQ